MSGLDNLRDEIDELKDDGYHTAADELGRIADEIERDLRRAESRRSVVAWRELADYMNAILDGRYPESDQGDYMRCNDLEAFQDWLRRCYIPRPVDADGELFDFNKIYDNGCGAIDRIYISERSIGDGKTAVTYNIVSHDEIRYSPNTLRAEEPDSIERLRDEMCNWATGCVGYDKDLDACKDCQVTDFFKRAEKLFKEVG